MKMALATVVSLATILFVGCGESGNRSDVKPDQLDELISGANRLIVREEPYETSKVLFESTDQHDLEELGESIQISPPSEWFHCMCDGTPAVFLYRDTEMVGVITNHHGQSIRTSIWESDALLANSEAWLSWFTSRKINEPRSEFDEMLARREESKKTYENWQSAMPLGIKPVWEDAQRGFGDAEIEPLRKALKSSIPETNDQILALLEWYGSGAGPWSGFPSYESVAEELLLGYEINKIVSVVNLNDFTFAQMEGAARFFGGWTFSMRHPSGLEKVPTEIKSALWNHVKDTEDEDKLGRARRAFKPADNKTE